MPFSIAAFARANRVVLIWTAFAALIYIMRDMFGLIFITFVMCFITHGVASKLHRTTRQRRKFLVIVIYLIFVSAIASFFIFGLPKILAEAKNFTEQLPRSLRILDDYLNSLAETNPSLAAPIERFKELLTVEALIDRGWAMARVALEKSWHYMSWFFIAICFSFLIMMDLPNLIRRFRALRYSRLASIYDETASSVIRFSQVVGENFRAQILISLINTTLTVLGLVFIGTGTVGLLGVVVFCCGLIPVLGVLISSAPIMLVALNVGGLNMVGAVLVLIVIVHLLEAYVLNPRIVSAVMRINPVITLMILYISHSVMGMWGMLLGVPISVYFYRQIAPNGAVNGAAAGAATGAGGGSPDGKSGVGADGPSGDRLCGAVASFGTADCAAEEAADIAAGVDCADVPADLPGPVFTAADGAEAR
ncbi:MAG: AI-2E family transporter [Deltaproteobacteria bacterium]|nr:AI-2E family transporter [Deltaproteobacteria bacterium]